MNILTIGVRNNILKLLNNLIYETCNNVIHIYEKDKALQIIKDTRLIWDWIILQGHDNPDHWKSILCAVNASATDTPITILSSHIDGTKLHTPVCSMHKNNENDDIIVSRCAMQNLLSEEKNNTVQQQEQTENPSPIIFEYHAPCR